MVSAGFGILNTSENVDVTDKIRDKLLDSLNTAAVSSASRILRPLNSLGGGHKQNT